MEKLEHVFKRGKNRNGVRRRRAVVRKMVRCNEHRPRAEADLQNIIRYSTVSVHVNISVSKNYVSINHVSNPSCTLITKKEPTTQGKRLQRAFITASAY